MVRQPWGSPNCPNGRNCQERCAPGGPEPARPASAGQAHGARAGRGRLLPAPEAAAASARCRQARGHRRGWERHRGTSRARGAALKEPPLPPPHLVKPQHGSPGAQGQCPEGSWSFPFAPGEHCPRQRAWSPSFLSSPLLSGAFHPQALFSHLSPIQEMFNGAHIQGPHK